MSQRKKKRGVTEKHRRSLNKAAASSGTEEKNKQKRMLLGRNKGPGSCTHQGKGKFRRGQEKATGRGWGAEDSRMWW